MSLVPVVPLIAVVVLLGTGVWVYRDAAANAEAGTPVTLVFGTSRIDTPEAWTIGCVVLFVVFLPLYLVARNGQL
jgi:hypothetical protein